VVRRYRSVASDHVRPKDSPQCLYIIDGFVRCPQLAFLLNPLNAKEKMKTPTIKIALFSSFVVLVALILPTPRSLEAQTTSNVPKAVRLANDLGRVDPSKEINLTVLLHLHNETEYDQEVEALYDPASPTYHQWFTAQDFARFAPTDTEFETVQKELEAHGLTVISSDPDRFSLRVHGIAANAESAFQTEIHTLRFNGKVFDAHVTNARLTGEAGDDLVASVAGLERHEIQPRYTLAKNLGTGQQVSKQLVSVPTNPGAAPITRVDELLNSISDIALAPQQQYEFYTNPFPALPWAVYSGAQYGVDPSLIISFTPSQLQDHYGLTPLISSGYDGTGQTVALVEAYGYAAAETDANAAATVFGLPALRSSNFSVVYPEGKPANPNAADSTGWTEEIALDIQAAHSIAPGAKILVVASAGQDSEYQIASLIYIIVHKLSNAVSSSWQSDEESLAGPLEEDAFNAVLKLGAALGISFQFASGNNGDLGRGTPLGAVSVPSNSPYATAVGGTSIPPQGYNQANPAQFVTGWGNNSLIISPDDSTPSVPPVQVGFLRGAGGGESLYFKKPSWQKELPGRGREVPDVSALADPYTGFAIVYSQAGSQVAQAGIGGTDLASPIFTSIWAIADQYNGKPLGLAGPAVAKLKPGQITDADPQHRRRCL
jgi:subtilase family serine protease